MAKKNTEKAPPPYAPDLSRLDCDPLLFDREAFADELLQRASHADLKRLQARLQQDCRQLECERKSLVHENYGKFIAISEKTHQLHLTMEDSIAVLGELLETVRAVRAGLAGGSST